MSGLLHYIRYNLSDGDRNRILTNINNNKKIQFISKDTQYVYTEPQYTQTYNSDYYLPSLSGPEFSICNFN